MGYGGQHRGTLQYQAIPVATSRIRPRAPEASSTSTGASGAWTRAGPIRRPWPGGPATLTLGSRLRRHGRFPAGSYNAQLHPGAQLGVEGDLRRSERDTAQAGGQYLQAEWEPHPRWVLDAGVRGTEINFRSTDFYSAGTNGNDGGATHFQQRQPRSPGCCSRRRPRSTLYANAGQGFETPTFDQLAYRPNGAA